MAVFDFLKKGPVAPAETKASATGPVIAYRGSGRVVWGPRDTVNLTKNGFTGNPVGFRAVKLIAEAAAAENAVDDIAHQIERLAVGLLEKVDQVVRLAAHGAEVHIGDPHRAVAGLVGLGAAGLAGRAHRMPSGLRFFTSAGWRYRVVAL